ncbi:MAG TPA: alkaline phosphatase family protein [Bryobacteraceae bacterium]|nr:alkaline phosphatase family protein [Bryobacteraceae bacterium]
MLKIRAVRMAGLCALWCASHAVAAPPPKLVLAIVVDQFRYDYLTRFRGDYHAGFERLLTKGAVFTNARYVHYPTVTAVGHSTFLSGATPSMSGIIGNEWYDRETGKVVTSVSDDSVKLLGANGEGASPKRLLVSTVGDELKMARSGGKVIGISLKDRSAILPAGHMADGAYWFDPRAGSFVSSTFYFAELPAWVEAYNASRPADKYRGAQWLDHTLAADVSVYAALEGSPFGNELVETFAERAVQAEKLGQRNATDLLAVSFSANDYVGHAMGPDSPEVKEMSIQTDRVFGKLFSFLDAAVGMGNVLVIMTADHGVAPVPEVNTARRMPGGRMPPGVVRKAVEAALIDKYGAGQWMLNPSDLAFYFNREVVAQKKLDEAEVERTAAEAARRIAHVYRVYTREMLLNGTVDIEVGRRVMNGFYAPRGPDMYVLLEPYWLYGAKGTTHSTTFSYDAHVPVIFMGPGIKAGRFDKEISVNDVAPTLATYLDIETPSGSVGRCLAEILN